MSKGVLVVYSGASGVGKGTIMKELLRLNENIRLSISATTRAPRPTERDGVEYFFVTKDKFVMSFGADFAFYPSKTNFFWIPSISAAFGWAF